MPIHIAVARTTPTLDTDSPRCRSAADRRAARLAARRAVAAALGMRKAAPLALVSTPDRAPHALLRRGGAWRPVPLALSVAHTDAHAAAAVTATGRIGVDLERARGVLPAHVRYFLCDAERASAPVAPAAGWALKEAAWKALGLTRDVPFHALTLRFERGRLIALRYAGRDHHVRAILRIPWPGWILAVVALAEAA